MRSNVITGAVMARQANLRREAPDRSGQTPAPRAPAVDAGNAAQLEVFMFWVALMGMIAAILRALQTFGPM
jgi:hypothetical protein